MGPFFSRSGETKTRVGRGRANQKMAALHPKYGKMHRTTLEEAGGPSNGSHRTSGIHRRRRLASGADPIDPRPGASTRAITAAGGPGALLRAMAPAIPTERDMRGGYRRCAGFANPLYVFGRRGTCPGTAAQSPSGKYRRRPPGAHPSQKDTRRTHGFRILETKRAAHTAIKFANPMWNP